MDPFDNDIENEIFNDLIEKRNKFLNPGPIKISKDYRLNNEIINDSENENGEDEMVIYKDFENEDGKYCDTHCLHNEKINQNTKNINCIGKKYNTVILGDGKDKGVLERIGIVETLLKVFGVLILAAQLGIITSLIINIITRTK